MSTVKPTKKGKSLTRTLTVSPSNGIVKKVREQIQRDTKFYQPGTPHIIGISMQVHYIKQINTVEQQFDAGFYLSYEFQPSEDDVKSWREAEKSGSLADWTPHYVPSFRFPNAFDFIQRDHKAYLDGSFYSLLVNGERDTRGAMVDMPFDYILAARLAIRGTFGEPLELHDFPFDCQELSINIASSAAVSMQIMVPHFRRKNFVNISQDVSTFPEWTPHPPVVDLTVSDPSKSARGLQFSDFNLVLKFERISKAYILRVYSQLALITITGFTMFAMNAEEELADRLATAFTLLLTAVAFMFVIESKLPNVPYLTAMDYYVITSFVFLLFLAGYSALCAPIGAMFGVELEDMEAYVMYICFGIWCLYHVGFVVSGVKAKKRNVATLKQIKATNESQLPIRVNSNGSNVPGIYWGEDPAVRAMESKQSAQLLKRSDTEALLMNE